MVVCVCCYSRCWWLRFFPPSYSSIGVSPTQFRLNVRPRLLEDVDVTLLLVIFYIIYPRNECKIVWGRYYYWFTTSTVGFVYLYLEKARRLLNGLLDLNLTCENSYAFIYHNILSYKTYPDLLTSSHTFRTFSKHSSINQSPCII